MKNNLRSKVSITSGVAAMLIFLLLADTSTAQDKLYLAKEAKAQFPDDDFVATESATVYDFVYKNGKGYYAYESVQEQFVCISKSKTFQYGVFYDEYSAIDKFSVKCGDNMNTNIRYGYYTDDDIFHSDRQVASSQFLVTHYASIVNLEYKKEYKDLKYLVDIPFTQPYSAMKKKIEVKIPAGLDIELVEMNFEGFDIKTEKALVEGTTVYTYTADSIPSYSDLPGLPGHSYLYPQLLVVSRGYRDKKGYTEIFGTVKSLYGWYNSLVKEMNNNRDTLRPLVTQLCEGKNDSIAKAKSIYYWVQNNIKYIAFEEGIAGYKPENCQTVYKDRYGDCKGMANLCKEMLVNAGLDARLAWIGTRTLAFDYTHPTLASDNHMICALKLGGQYIYLDPTEKYSRFGEYAERIQDQQVLIADGDSFILERIPNMSYAQNTNTVALNLTLSPDLHLRGKVDINLSGESKSNYISHISLTEKNKQTEAIRKFLTYEEPNIEVSNVSAPALNQDDATIVLSGTVDIKGKVNSFEDETYLYINPFQLYKNFDFGKERKFAYWFQYKKDEQVSVQLSVPAGYKIMSIPEGVNAENPDFSISTKFSQTGNLINYQLQVRIPNAEIASGNIAAWNAAIAQLKKEYNQPILLKKL